MLLEIGDRHLDVTHRALVAGSMAEGSSERALQFIAAGVEAIVVPASSMAAEVWNRVEVPVGVLVDPDRVVFSPGEELSAAGPFEAVGPERIAHVVSAIAEGARVVLTSDAGTVRGDRRVAEVMARILAARAAAAEEELS